MANPVIEAIDISKVYRINRPGSGSLRQDLQQAWQQLTNRKSGFFKLPEQQRTTELRALNHVSFSIEEGEILGIIGPNGAGKSTLLKILSRITKPTEGIIKGHGRVSSLLEIGTGFHHELSGRENIFLSGYMLGMTKNDIKQRFDEIVEFSGVHEFLDTPVKRYSSGMYVRLGFAVAAHLDPDILIVDEVLAVGDAEFQRKCIGKMKEVSAEKGRTILFVSHSMQAVSNLCNRAMLLQKGRIMADGAAKPVIEKYLAAFKQDGWKYEWLNGEPAPGNEFITMRSVELIPDLREEQEVVDVRTPLTVKFSFVNHSPGITLSTGLHLFTASGECIFDVATAGAQYGEEIIEGECRIPGNFLNDGSYYFSIIFVRDTSRPVFYFENCLQFDVEDHRENIAWYGKWRGYVRPQFPFSLTRVNAPSA